MPCSTKSKNICSIFFFFLSLILKVLESASFRTLIQNPPSNLQLADASGFGCKRHTCFIGKRDQFDLLTSGLWEWAHLVDVRFCIGPVNLHRDKPLFRARRRGEGGFGHEFGLPGQRFWRRRRSRERRRRWGQRRKGRRFGASTGRLDPWERTNVVLGDSRQLSTFDEFFSGRYSLLNCCVVPGGLSGGVSLVVQ